jgi:hypothetical protein
MCRLGPSYKKAGLFRLYTRLVSIKEGILKLTAYIRPTSLGAAATFAFVPGLLHACGSTRQEESLRRCPRRGPAKRGVHQAQSMGARSRSSSWSAHVSNAPSVHKC